MRGRLMGVSLGPGDPELLTRKAWRALHSNARWCFPVRRRGGRSHALEIVVRAGLTVPGDAIELVFPMTHDRAVLARAWDRAARMVLPVLQAGRDVAFLVEGDASTYSTFTYLARRVRQLDEAVRVETIAGVSSFHAAAAEVVMPLVETDDTLAVLPAGYGIDELDRLLAHFDTLVLLKVKPLLDEVIAWLAARELLASAVFVEKVGTPEARIVRDVASLRGAKVHYLSLMLVRNPSRPRGVVVRGCRKKGREHE